MDAYLAAQINPKWRKWFAEQTAETQAAVLQVWADTATDTEIAQASRSADYARGTRLIAECARQFGYEP